MVKKMLPPESLKTLYNSSILPHIQYGLVAWGNSKGQSMKIITKIQKQVVRTISKSYMNLHTEPRMKQLGILKIDGAYKHQCLTLIHDVMYENCPATIRDFVKLTAAKNSYLLRAKDVNPLDVQGPNLKTKQGQNSFRLKGPLFWNKLSNESRELKKRNLFKKHTKKHLMENYPATITM
jgi:hypothetical protein